MKTLLISVFALSALTIQSRKTTAQTTPGALRDTAIQSELMKKTQAFDSLLLVNTSSYWEDDHTIFGYGFIDAVPHFVRIQFKAQMDTCIHLQFKSLHHRKIRNREILIESGKLEMNRLKMLSQDSLDLKTRSGKYIDISDGLEWSLLIIDQLEHKLYLKQAYMPDMYVRTEDKDLFIGIILQTQDLLINRK